MTAYIARRLLLLIPIWFGVLTLVFLMRVLVPGDPVDIMFFGQQSDPAVKAPCGTNWGWIARCQCSMGSTSGASCMAISARRSPRAARW